MPRKAQIPEHWKEGTDQPSWTQQDEIEEEYPTEDELYDEYEMHPGSDYEEEAFILGKSKEPTDYIQPEMSETEQLEKEYQDLLQKKVQRRGIKEQKQKIRQLKYEPAYEIGSSIHEGIAQATGKLKGLRGTPEQRAMRKERFKQAMQGLSAKSSGTMAHLGGSIGGGSLGSGMPNLSNEFSGGQTMNLLDGNRAQVLSQPAKKQPTTVVNIFGGPGSGVMGGNLLGESKSGLMHGDILGSGKPKRTVSKPKRKTTKKKSKKKKRKTKTIRKKRTIKKMGMFEYEGFNAGGGLI